MSIFRVVFGANVLAVALCSAPAFAQVVQDDGPPRRSVEPPSPPTFGLGAGPLLTMDIGEGPLARDARSTTYIGAELQVFGNLPLMSWLTLRLGGAGAPSGGERGLLVPLCFRASFLFAITDSVSSGVGACVGYVATPDPDDDTSHELDSSAMIKAELHPISIALDNVAIEPLLGLGLSATGATDDRRVEPTMLTTGFSLTYTFPPSR